MLEGLAALPSSSSSPLLLPLLLLLLLLLLLQRTSTPRTPRQRSSPTPTWAGRTATGEGEGGRLLSELLLLPLLPWACSLLRACVRCRGAALGALMGLAHGAEAWPRRWVDGLAQGPAILREAAALGEDRSMCAPRASSPTLPVSPALAADVVAEKAPSSGTSATSTSS